MAAKKCTKKHDACPKLLLCQSKPTAFLLFLLPLLSSLLIKALCWRKNNRRGRGKKKLTERNLMVQEQCSTKKTLHTPGSHEGCSKLAVKMLLVNSFKLQSNALLSLSICYKNNFLLPSRPTSREEWPFCFMKKQDISFTKEKYIKTIIL